MHFKTSENFALKCIIFAKNFQTFPRRLRPYPSYPYSKISGSATVAYLTAVRPMTNL